MQLSPTATSSKADISATTLELVMAAVRIARNEHLTTVARVRARLQQLYPKVESSDIQDALAMWGARERKLNADEPRLGKD